MEPTCKFRALLHQLADEHIQLHKENARLRELLHLSSRDELATADYFGSEVEATNLAVGHHLSCKLNEDEPRRPPAPPEPDNYEGSDSLAIPVVPEGPSREPSKVRATRPSQASVAIPLAVDGEPPEVSGSLPLSGFGRGPRVVRPSQRSGRSGSKDGPSGLICTRAPSKESDRSGSKDRLPPGIFTRKDDPGSPMSPMSSMVLSFSERRDWSSYLRLAMRNSWFDSAMGFVIVLNSVMIAFESTARLNNEDTTVYGLLEHLFLFIYLVELNLRFYAFGWWVCLQSSWVRFDCFMVGLGVLGSWVIAPILMLASAEGQSNTLEWLDKTMILRTFRVFRLVRALRLLVRFRNLWMLVQGLIHSSDTICYTLFLLSVLLFLFSCISIEVITIPYVDEESPFGDMVREYWCDVPTSMLTLIRFVNLDSLAVIYEPMVKSRSHLLLFFVPILLLVSITLMNLVTAVIVEGALEQASKDKEAQVSWKKHKLKQLMPALRILFQELDQDGSGQVTIEEISEAGDDIREELEQALGTYNLDELFYMIDSDQSGEVSIDEFIEGVSALTCADSQHDMSVIMMKQMASMQRSLGILRCAVGSGSTRAVGSSQRYG